MSSDKKPKKTPAKTVNNQRVSIPPGSRTRPAAQKPVGKRKK